MSKPRLAVLFALLGLLAHSSLANETLQGAAAQLQQVGELEQQSRQLLKQAGALRKQIRQQRQDVLKLSDTQQGQQATAELQSQLQLSNELQQQGRDLRKQSVALLNEARQGFAAGLQQRWPQWLRHNGPIQLASSAASGPAPRLGGHNSRTRSVHPKKKDLAGQPQTREVPDMSLALPLMTAQQVPGDLDTASTQISRSRRLLGHIEVEADNGEPGIALNEMHNWRFLLSDVHGEPVSGASIEFTGHMPGHVHGLPTQPRMTAELADGVYRLSGVKFQMRGWWVIELLVEHGGSKDSIRFHLLL